MATDVRHPLVPGARFNVDSPHFRADHKVETDSADRSQHVRNRFAQFLGSQRQSGQKRDRHAATGIAGEPAIVLLHGATFRSEDWENIFPRLATRYRVIAYDARGHGKSGRAASYAIGDLADDLLRAHRWPRRRPGHRHRTLLGRRHRARGRGEASDGDPRARRALRDGTR